MEIPHPRQETEQQRAYARRQLRDRAERLVKRHGYPSPLSPLARSVELRLEDGLPGVIVSIKGNFTQSKLDVIKVNQYHSDDLLGPFTQFTSNSPGEFTRSDVNPRAASGMRDYVEGETLTYDEMADEMRRGAVMGATQQVANMLGGLDNHPITAQEARNVLDMLNGATIVRPKPI